MTESRQCIKCENKLEPIVVLEVEIDRCPSCGGIWLDSGEIERLAQRDDTGDLERAIAQLAKSDTGVTARDQGVVDPPCPACAGKLTVVVFGGSHMEQCSKCHGVFVDRGELSKAMALVSSNEATTIMALAGSVHTSGTIGS